MQLPGSRVWSLEFLDCRFDLDLDLDATDSRSIKPRLLDSDLDLDST